MMKKKIEQVEKEIVSLAEQKSGVQDVSHSFGGSRQNQARTGGSLFSSSSTNANINVGPLRAALEDLKLLAKDLTV